MAELDGMEEMKKSLEAGAMMRSSAEQTGPAEEPEAQTEEFTRKFFLKTSEGIMVDLLNTDPLFMAARAETSGYSITPTTFQSRTFFGNTEPSGGEKKESHAGSGDARAAEEPIHHPRSLTYIDEFAFGTNTVVRFGINSEFPEIKDMLVEDGIKLYSMDDDAATTVTRKSAKYTPSDAKSIKLSTIETELLNMGILELISGKKVVVLDIFERQNGGEKNGCVNTKDEKIKTHSVVLYKNYAESSLTDEAPEILVIDPSNFLFSSHLSNYRHSSGIEVKTCHTGIQVYKSPTDSEGPHYDQHRDCIDVAVKIALGLNASEYRFDCTGKQAMINSIKECSTILNLSNVGALDKTMETLGSGPARVKQTSDQTLWDIFYTARKTIKQNLDALNALDEQNLYREELVIIRDEFMFAIEVSASPQKIIKDFVSQNARYVELFSQIPAKYQEQLLGSIDTMEDTVDYS